MQYRSIVVALAFAAACAKESSKPAVPATLTRVAITHPQLDQVYALPGSPQGLATNGTELIIGNRRDPWGVLRIRRTAEGALAPESIPILTPAWDQKMDVQALTWNGTHYVGYTSAAWFGRRDGNVFTLHDPATLRVLRQHPAPKLLGCLVWDGSGYWAASRRNTRDADEPKKLYRLDAQFNVVREHEAPGVGCQGAAWDGKQLWLADVFDDAIYVLDVSGSEPRLVHRAYADIEYLSGIVWFERQLWITDYGNDRLQRIRPAARLAWSRGEHAPREREEVAEAAVVPVEVREPPLLLARNADSFPEREPDDTDAHLLEAELRGSSLYGSWTLWFGHDLFARGEQSSSLVTIPQFARYEITVRRPDGSEVEKTFEAVAGENVMREVLLLPDATAPGEYRVDVFLHVQYVTRDGEAKILNNSAGSVTVRR